MEETGVQPECGQARLDLGRLEPCACFEVVDLALR
jgi:hypothetical protein